MIAPVSPLRLRLLLTAAAALSTFREPVLEERVQPALETLRHHNRILFGFDLERSLASLGQRFSRAVFETLRHFDRSIA